MEQIKSASPVKRFSRKISIRELELLIKKTKKILKKLILLAVPASEEQVQPSGQSKTIRETVSREPEKTIAREQNSSLRRTSPGGQTEPSE